MKRSFDEFIMFAYFSTGALAGVFVNHRTLTTKVRSFSVLFSLSSIFYAVLRSRLIFAATATLQRSSFCCRSNTLHTPSSCFVVSSVCKQVCVHPSVWFAA